jgi:putative flavoprotein involved in K+ transport
MTRVFDTVIVGGGQAGLAMGYYLKRQGCHFIILDAGGRVGDAWRNRWDSLKLFTPAAFSALPGWSFPAPGASYPSKDAMADYLEGYARRFALPVVLNRRVDTLQLDPNSYVVQAGGERYQAEHVIVASGAYHAPYIPAFAVQLDPAIMQIHSRDYRNPGQLPEGDVLIVGAGNSGAEIAIDVAASRRVYLSGRDTGSIPSAPSGALGITIVRPFWYLLGRLDVNADTRFGRKARLHGKQRGAPLIRLKLDDLDGAGIQRVPRTESVCQGKPVLADGRALQVSAVIWATGFRPDFRWIQLPVFGTDGYPRHRRGIVAEAPGLFFVGLPFQHSVLSAVIGGVGNDARFLATELARASVAPRGSV